MSIRQIDRASLPDTNVDYSVSLSVIIDIASHCTRANIGPFLNRVYRGYRTNRRKPSQIQKYILNELQYNPENINIFCWYSAQDM